jgi:hypothetical protein
MRAVIDRRPAQIGPHIAGSIGKNFLGAGAGIIQAQARSYPAFRRGFAATNQGFLARLRADGKRFWAYRRIARNLAGRLFELLRIPSISTQPAHRQDCRKAAEWARDTLRKWVSPPELSETSGLPGVVATHHAAGPNAPHVLFYGHYDVQPPTRWNSGIPTRSTRSWWMARAASGSSRAVRWTTKARWSAFSRPAAHIAVTAHCRSA